MMTQEELTKHLRKKLGTGYSDEEIRNELLSQGYSETEIENALLLAHQKPKAAGSPLMIFVSVMFIILGIWRFNDGMTTWGSILIAWGTITLIIRAMQLSR